MSKETTPAPAAPAPAPAAAPITPASAPAAAPAPAAPALPPRDDSGRFTAPSAQSKPKPTLSAKKALRLDEDPSKSVDAILKKQRAGRKNVGGTDPETPAAPAAAAPVAAPVPVTPAAPAAPSAAPTTPPAAPAPAAEPKVKVGDKEYTTAELEALLKQQAAPAPAPTPAPAASAQPDAPKQPTAEEIQAREQEFIQTAIQSMPATELTEEQLDTILAGGKEAVTLFDQLQRKAAAHAVLLASKNIATQLNPILAQLSQQLQPVVSQHIEVQRYQVEQAFLNKHADFAPHIQTARQVAEALMVQYPQECAQMTQDAFIDEVARQTDLLLTADYRKFNPKATSWRQQTAPAPAAPPAPAPAPTAAPAAPATPAPAAPPAPAPLAAVLPAGKSAANLPWAKGVAATLRG